MTSQTKWKAMALTSALFAGASAGCIAPGPQTPSAAPGSAATIGKGNAPASAAAAAPAAAGGFHDCGPDALIDDGEDGNNQNNPAGNRGGYWYTFVDKAGSTVTPMAGEQGGQFAMTEGGANGSHFAANYKGHIATGAAIVFSGMGMNFIDPKGVYDSSKYAGISFWAKRGENSTGKVRLKVPDASTDPEGGVCSECFNDFGADINLTTEWKRYVFPFRKMTQLPGWGSPRRPHVDPSKLFGVQFQVNVPGANYDIWIDDLSFVCP